LLSEAKGLFSREKIRVLGRRKKQDVIVKEEANLFTTFGERLPALVRNAYERGAFFEARRRGCQGMKALSALGNELPP